MKKFWIVLLLAVSAFMSNAEATDQLTAPLTNFVQKAGDTRSAAKFQADCAAGLALDSCVGSPTPKGCGPGRHWSTLGSGVAHCVADDPTCVGDNYVTHDALGNPSCVAPVYTNGVETRVLACSSGYQGAGTNQQRSLTTNTYTGVTTYGAWTTTYSDCTPTPPPTCANGASDYPTCTPPTCSNGGTNWPTCTPPPPPTCANGASNYPTCTFPPPPTCANGASNYPVCTPPVATCSASDVVVSSTPCSGSQVGGPIAQHQTVSCPGSTVGSYTTGSCSAPPTCANGALNYPTCTLAATPVPPPDVFYIGFRASNDPTTYTTDVIKYDCSNGGVDICTIYFDWSMSNATTVSVKCVSAYGSGYDGWADQSSNAVTGSFTWSDPPAGTSMVCTITASGPSGSFNTGDSVHLGN